MQRILNTIITKINDSQNLFAEAGIQPPATIDFYAGQPEQPDSFEFVTPAVFIDYSADYNNEVLYVYLHCLYDFTPDTENFAPVRLFDHLTYYKTIKRVVRGVKCLPVFGPIKLYQDDPILGDYCHYHRIVFAGFLFDDLDEDYNKYIDTSPVEAIIERGKLKDKQ